MPPSAALGDDGTFWLAYRLRRPLGAGRGYANVVARSEDGERFETVLVLEREAFDCDSLERPALVALDDGAWRLYVSCATPGTKHWRVDALDADRPVLVLAGLGPDRPARGRPPWGSRTRWSSGATEGGTSGSAAIRWTDPTTPTG